MFAGSRLCASRRAGCPVTRRAVEPVKKEQILSVCVCVGKERIRKLSTLYHSCQFILKVFYAAQLNLRFLYGNLLHYISLACRPVSVQPLKMGELVGAVFLNFFLNIQFFMKSGKKPFLYVPNSFSSKLWSVKFARHKVRRHECWLIRLQHEMQPYILL